MAASPGGGRSLADPQPSSLAFGSLTAFSALLLLLGATVAAYWPAFFAGFIWDDNIFYESSQVREWGGIVDLWFNLGNVGSESHYWPVLYTSLWLDHKIWGGFDPAGFHFTNVLLHCINTGLLWHLLRRMNIAGAWLIAAFFALHPLRVESVAWVIARKDLLSTLFYLLAFGCWLRYQQLRESGSSRRGGRGSHDNQQQVMAYIGLLVFYLLGILSKTLAITLPAALLIWTWWQHGQIRGRDIKDTAPLFVIAAVMAVIGIDFFTGRTLIEFEYAWYERLIIAGKALWFYAEKTLWPQPLHYIYQLWDVSWQSLRNWLPLLAAMGLAAGLYFASPRIGRGPLAAALFFAVTLSPMLGFVDNSYMKFAFVADRYQYLAGVGLLMLLVGGGVTLWQEASRTMPQVLHKYAVSVAAAPLLLACAVLTHQRATLFQDKVVLFQGVVAHNPAAYEAYYNLGTFLMERERTAEAIEAFTRGLEYEPHRIKMYVNLSSALMDMERHAEAEVVLQDAIAREPEDFAALPDPHGARYEAAGVHTNMGMVLMDLGRHAEAEAALQRALQLDSTMNQARRNMVALLHEQERHAESLQVLQDIARREPSAGLYCQMADVATVLGLQAEAESYQKQAQSMGSDCFGGRLQQEAQQAAVHFNAGRFAEALALYEQIAAMYPDSAENHGNLALTLAQLGRLQEAQQSLERTLQLAPDYVQVLRQFANVHLAAGRQEQARQALQRLLQSTPDDIPALNQVAAIYFDESNFDTALELFRRSIALDPNNAGTHANIGATLARAGRLQEAVLSFERAVQLNPESASARNQLQLARQQLNGGN